MLEILVPFDRLWHGCSCTCRDITSLQYILFAVACTSAAAHSHMKTELLAAGSRCMVLPTSAYLTNVQTQVPLLIATGNVHRQYGSNHGGE